MQTLEDIKQQLKVVLANRPSVSIDLLFITVNTFNSLPELMQDGEVIKGYCLGLVDQRQVQTPSGVWLVVCTNLRVVFVKKGLVSGVNHFSFPLESITTYTPKTGWFFGEVNLVAAGSAIQISQIGKADFRFFAEAMKEVLAKN